MQIPPSASQENIRVHLCATCVSLYQWGWLFIPPPPEQKMNHELRWQDSLSTGCEQFPKELKRCLTCKWKLNADNFRLHSTETEERQHVKSYLEKCIVLFILMPATHSRKLQFGAHFLLQILVFRKYSGSLWELPRPNCCYELFTASLPMFLFANAPDVFDRWLVLTLDWSLTAVPRCCYTSRMWFDIFAWDYCPVIWPSSARIYLLNWGPEIWV